MTDQPFLIVPILLPLAGVIGAGLLPGKRAGVLVFAITLLTAAVSIVILQRSIISGPLVNYVGGWQPPQGIVLVSDITAAILVLTTSVLALAAALHSLVSHEMLDNRRYHTVFLVMLAALYGVFFAGDIFTLYIFMEMVILSSVILVAMAERPISAEVTFKYAVLSATASMVLLFSIGIIYAALGTLNIASIAQRTQEGQGLQLIPLGTTLMLAAFLFKAAIVPFHIWQPDAHSAAPSAVSAMLSGILVKVGAYGVIRMATLMFPESPGLMALLPVGIISALFGGLAALANTNLKRLLAYSTIANMGLIMVAIGWGGNSGMLAALVNIINHAWVKGSLFLVGGYLADRYKIHSLHDLRGFASLAPGSVILFGLGALALAGLPPTSGFLAKFTLIQAGIADGTYPMLGLIILAIALGIVYSIRVFVLLAWGETRSWVLEKASRLQRQPGGLLAAAFLVGGFLILGIWPSPLISIAVLAATELQNPPTYIQAVLGGIP